MTLNQFVDKTNQKKIRKKQSVYLFTEKTFRASCSWPNLKVSYNWFITFTVAIVEKWPPKCAYKRERKNPFTMKLGALGDRLFKI